MLLLEVLPVRLEGDLKPPSGIAVLQRQLPQPIKVLLDYLLAQRKHHMRRRGAHRSLAVVKQLAQLLQDLGALRIQRPGLPVELITWRLVETRKRLDCSCLQCPVPPVSSLL